MSLYRARTTLEQWRIFQAVVNCGGYAQAAQVLSKSQSSLNHAVSKLQDQLGVQLLEVKGRKAVLTQAGTVMLRRSQLLTQQVEDLEQLADSLEQGWEPSLTIACEHIQPKEPLYRALKQFLPQSRGTRVSLLSTVLSGTVEAITDASADIVITPDLPRGVLGKPFGQIKMVMVANQHHPLAVQRHITHDDLVNHLQLVIRDSGRHPNSQHGWLRAEQRWTLSSFVEAIELLERGLGFAWVPEHMIKAQLAEGTLVHLNVKEGATLAIATYLVVPKPLHQGPASSCLEHLLLQQNSALKNT